MKRKRFTKADRRWCYTLLKLIKTSAKLSPAAAPRCPQVEKKKKSEDFCFPKEELVNLLLNSKNAENEELSRSSPGICKQLNGSENGKYKNTESRAKKKVSFAANTKGSGDTYDEKRDDTHDIILKFFENKQREVAKRIFENRIFQKHFNLDAIRFYGKGMGLLTERQILQALTARLNKLKDISSTTDRNEDVGESVNYSGPKPLRKKIRYNYKLTKNSVRKIPFGFLKDIKDVVPGGVDEMIDRHTRRKNSVHCKEIKVPKNSGTTINFMKRIETVDQVKTKIKEPGFLNNHVQEPLYVQENKGFAVSKNIIKKSIDISSRVAEDYKRVSLALFDKKTVPEWRQQNEANDFIVDDSFEDLQNIVQGKKHVITADVDGKPTKILKNNFHTVRNKVTEPSGKISGQSKPNKTCANDKIDKVGNTSRVKKKKTGERIKIMKHGGCECYLKNMLKDREPYLNNLGLSGV